MDSVEAVEKILKYSFVNKTLLKAARTLTSPLFDRLEFLGDSVLDVAFTNYIYHTYPYLKSKELRELRAANVSNEKLARVAVNHNLYQFLLLQNPSLSKEIKEFSEAVSKESDPAPYGGLVKAPTILADIVESIAGAVYIDVNYDVQRLWQIFTGLFEPIYTPDDLRQQPKPPFLTLFRLADKHGKLIDFRYSEDDDSNNNIAEVYLDDIFIASGCAKRIDTTKLLAAEGALQKFSECVPTEKIIGEDNPYVEPEDAKGKSFEICSSAKLQLQTESSCFPTDSENPLTDEMTQNQIVIHEDSANVEPEDVKRKSVEIFSTEKLHLQAESSGFPTASENPLTDGMTQEQMVMDKDNPHIEPRDAKGKLFEICSSRRRQIQTASSSLPNASVNPVTYEMTTKQMVVDKDRLNVEREDFKGKLLEICTKNKWPRPVFSVEEERGQKNEQKFVCSVKIEIPTIEGTFHMKGDAKSKRRQAEKSSAYHMIRALESPLMSLAISNLQMPKSLDKKNPSFFSSVIDSEPVETVEPEKIIDEDTPHVEPEDVKAKSFEICSTKKLQRQTGSSSLPPASENPLSDETTEEQMVTDKDSLHVEPEDVNAKSFAMCSTEKLLLQAESSSLPISFENPLTDELTQEQIIVDENSPHVEPEDEKGKLFEFCSTRKLQTETGSSSLPTASENPSTYEMTTKQMVLDKDSLHVETKDVKGKLFEICAKNKWPDPIFSVEKERGPKDEQKYVCSVKIEIPTIEGTFHMKGDAKSKKKQAENSSANHMIRALNSSMMSLVTSNLQMPKSLDEKKKNLQMQGSIEENKNLHSKKRRTS